MSEVINLFGNDPEKALRNIADMIADGELPNNSATVIIGSEVFHAGNIPDDQAVLEAVFNMNVGIHKLIRPIFLDDL